MPIYSNNFSTDTSQNLFEKDNKKVVRLNSNLQFSPVYQFNKPAAAKKWFRFSGIFECNAKEWNIWKQAQFIVRFLNNDTEVQTNMIRVYRFLNQGEKKEIYLDAIAPPSWDKVSIQVWNASSDKELFWENLDVIMFDE